MSTTSSNLYSDSKVPSAKLGGRLRAGLMKFEFTSENLANNDLDRFIRLPASARIVDIVIHSDSGISSPGDWDCRIDDLRGNLIRGGTGFLGGFLFFNNSQFNNRSQVSFRRWNGTLGDEEDIQDINTIPLTLYEQAGQSINEEGQYDLTSIQQGFYTGDGTVVLVWTYVID